MKILDHWQDELAERRTAPAKPPDNQSESLAKKQTWPSLILTNQNAVK